MSTLPNPFQSEYYGEWFEDTVKLFRIAEKYIEDTESFDRGICTGPIIDGSIIPRTGNEMVTISRYARQRMEEAVLEAEKIGYNRQALIRVLQQLRQ